MAFIHSPKIVTDGLVLLLDTANPRCYISGSNTWYDLSGNNKHFQLGPAIGYSPLYGGEIQFPGDVAGNTVSSSIAVTNASSCTVQIWTRTIDTTGLYLMSEPTPTYYIQAYANSGIMYENSSGFPTNRANGNVISTMAPYLNNQYFFLESKPVDFSSWTVFRIGNNGGNFSLSGSIAQVAIYNRTLTAQESLQNFNAMRGRFGI